MKRKTITLCILIIALIPIFIFANSEWEGNAAMSRYGEFPSSGYYGASNTFARNTIVQVENIENGREIQVIITNRLNDPGVFLLLSPEAATQLQMAPNELVRVRVTVPTTSVSQPSNLPDDLPYHQDPDVNPSASAGNHSSLVFTLEADEEDTEATETEEAVEEADIEEEIETSTYDDALAYLEESSGDTSLFLPYFEEPEEEVTTEAESEDEIEAVENPEIAAEISPEEEDEEAEEVRQQVEDSVPDMPAYTRQETPAEGQEQAQLSLIAAPETEEADDLNETAEEDVVPVQEEEVSGPALASPAGPQAESLPEMPLPDIALADQQDELLSSSQERPETPEPLMESVAMAEAEITDTEEADIAGLDRLRSPQTPSIETGFPEIVVEEEDSAIADAQRPLPEEGADIDPELAGIQLAQSEGPDSPVIEIPEPLEAEGIDEEYPELALRAQEIPDADNLIPESGPADTDAEIALDVPEIESPSEEIAERVELPEDAQITLQPAEFRPPQVPHPEEELIASSLVEEEETEVTLADPEIEPEDVPEISEEEIEEPEIEEEIAELETEEDEEEPETIVVELEEEESRETMPLDFPMISQLEPGSDYIQMGVYATRETATVLISSLDRYPVAVMETDAAERTLYKVLIGPLREDESGALYHRFRSQGYRDIFIRRGM